MSTIKKNVETAKTLDPLDAALSPRVTRGLAACDVRTLWRQAQEIRARYRGGLPAELQSRDKLLTDAKLLTPRHASPRRTADGSVYDIRSGRSKRPAIRRVLVSRIGRRIDLVALLNQSRPNKMPLWALVDPRHPIGSQNGGCYDDGRRSIGWCEIRNLAKRDQPGTALSVPGGMPVLPPRVREILADQKLMSRVRWAGVLYQPDEWSQVNPDPALVVEWTDAPGEYYALAVWGGDRAQIMEWVD